MKIIILQIVLAVFSTSAYGEINEPIMPIPEPVTSYPKRVELGRFLFNDVRLSNGAQVSCASCHALGYGGADGQMISTGVKGRKGSINSPSIFNCALNFRQFWNGRAVDLLQQLDGPISNPNEMDFSWQQTLNILAEDPFYLEMFNAAYKQGLSIDNIKDALVSYEKSLLTPNSRFDLFLKGDLNAITDDEKAGYILFKEYGCVSCHQGIAVGGNLFQKFGVFGDYFVDRGNITEADLGRFAVTKVEQDRYVFKVPSLRNVALTAPYFHDGQVQNLSEAVMIMMRYQLGRVPEQGDIRKIVLFLNTLTGQYQGQTLWKK